MSARSSFSGLRIQACTQSGKAGGIRDERRKWLSSRRGPQLEPRAWAARDEGAWERPGTGLWGSQMECSDEERRNLVRHLRWMTWLTHKHLTFHRVMRPSLLPSQVRHQCRKAGSGTLRLDFALLTKIWSFFHLITSIKYSPSDPYGVGARLTKPCESERVL